MKKTTILFVLGLGALYIIISAYAAGPAAVGQYECTGAETGLGNKAGCYVSGCHGSASATTGISVVLELDSAGGVPTTNYIGGGSYTVKLTGTNNMTTSLPRFGFQLASIKGSSSQVTPTSAGTWVTPYPASTHYAVPGQYMAVGVMEHSVALSPASGSGGNGTLYSKSFKWTAPVAGTGTVSFWAVLNAVNGNGQADAGDHWNTAQLIINEWPAITAIATPGTNSFALNVFPVPASDHAELDYTLETNAFVKADLYDLSGKKVADIVSEKQTPGEHLTMLNLSAMNLKRGVYIVQFNAGDLTSTRKIVVQQ